MWFLLLPLWFVFNVLALILAPVLPLFATESFGACDNNNALRTEPRLPAWLSWFQTPDNSLNGDGTFERLNPPGYWSKVLWLWRNPAYGFERSVLAAHILPASTLTFIGEPQIGDKPQGLAGWCFVRIDSYWGFTYVKRVGATRCIKIVLGWKLKTYAEKPARLGQEPIAQYVFSPRITTFKE